MMEIIGWIGGVCLSLCGVPQAIQCLQEGHSKGLHNWFLVLWACGEMFTFVYILSFDKLSWPLIINYIVNITMLGIMVKYKVWPRKQLTTDRKCSKMYYHKNLGKEVNDEK